MAGTESATPSNVINSDSESLLATALGSMLDPAEMLARREGLLARYGSEDAVLAPCPKERLLLAAVASCGDTPAPESIEAAIRAAYPLPTTCVEAAAEYSYWTERNDDLCAMWGAWGEEYLHPLPRQRSEIVRALLERELTPRTLADIRARVAFLATCDRMWDHNDQRLVMDGLESVAASVQADSSQYTSTRKQITEALKADASRSDRSIARALKCSPTTVGRVRRSLGLDDAPRSVQRRGQMFQGRYGRKRAPTALHD